jgi:uncharacterized protein (UPF0261 family)
LKKVIAIIGTLDTKGEEIAFLKALIEKRGHQTLVVDTGILGTSYLKADISREKVAEFGGEMIEKLIKKNDESFAQKIMSMGLKKVILPRVESGDVDGLIAIGGGQGSVIASSMLKSLPFGFPKLLISTKASQAGIRPYIGIKDILVLPPVADLAGINRLTKKVLINASGAISGMVEVEAFKNVDVDKPLVVVSMNGTVTDCGLSIKNVLEKKGYEVLVFHSIGTGGEALEEYVNTESDIVCVIELAVNEVGNYLLGGLASAGPHRLETAGKRGIPQVIVPGSADFINFLGPETVPEKFKNRKIHYHNPQATIVRTSLEDNKQLGKTLAEKLNHALGPVSLLWPERGLSTVDKSGKPFWSPESDSALLESLKTNLRADVRIVEVDAHINDPIFADGVVEEFEKILTK